MKHERIRWRKPPHGYKRQHEFVSLPTAVLGSAAIGAGGSIVGSFLQSNAANNSIQAQQQMFQEGADIQQGEYSQGLAQLLKMYGIGLDSQGNYVQQGVNTQANYFNQAANALNPVIQGGANVLPTLTSLLTPGADMTSTLEQIPGFKFAQQYGQKAITNQATSRGLSGNVLTAGADYATGAATQAYGGIVQQLMDLYKTGAGAAGTLGGIAGSVGNAGLSALTGAGNAALTGATNVGGSALSGATATGNAILSSATGVGQNTGQTMVGQGQAQAAGALGVANAGSNALNSATNLSILNALSGGKLGSAGLFGNSNAGSQLNLNPASTFGSSGSAGAVY